MALEKAAIRNLETGVAFTVMFNPTEYGIAKKVNFAQIGIPGLNVPVTQYVHGEARTLEMELFFDTYEENREGSNVINQAGEDVRRHTRKVTDLMIPEASTHAPPRLEVSWGTDFVFSCVLASVNQRFVLFLQDGTPVRARLEVLFNEFKNVDLEAKEIKRETTNFSELYVVRQGDTLSAIAGRAYGNPTLWRPIALMNQVINPRRLRVGEQLAIPRLPFQDPETGEIYQ